MTARQLQKLTGLEVDARKAGSGKWLATGTLPRRLDALVTAEGRTEKEAILRLRQENLNYLTKCLVRKQQGRCCFCAQPGQSFHFEHIVSRAKGGLDVIQNGRACGSGCCTVHDKRHGVPQWRVGA